ncbi:hypothetical protein HPB49_006094 [Dermacentor silvarum]|uniref:Uncharacterized protein n=1 Tax=Dermacentor silvarum TaxID=543639 RepID=A0ACB8DW01_DERSI|nr:hypothetical protein HPB49_006094 [Dermacentor silvarum]
MDCQPGPPPRTPLTTVMELETTNGDDPVPEGYPEDPADGSWLTARGRRGRRADARGPHLCPSMILKSSCAQETVSRSVSGLDTLTRAVGIEAGLKGQEVDELHLRVQVAQNIALISTPSEIIATNLNKMASLTLGPHRYPISAYIASPDNSCKGIITGPDAGTTPTEHLDHLLAPGVEILHDRMMGRRATAIITFVGLKVPRYVRYYGAEYRCYIHAPRAQVCGICLTVGHRADVCPTPSIKRCTTCGTENPSSTEPHQCQPRCLTCKGDHPTTDPSCPSRARKPPNKKRVRRELEKQKRQQNHPRTQSKKRRSRFRSPSRSRSPSRGPADSSKNSERDQPSSSSSPPSSPPPAKKKPPPLPQQLPSAAAGGPAGPKGPRGWISMECSRHLSAKLKMETRAKHGAAAEFDN